MDESAIRWTDSTWNPMTGCTKISPGCKFCYAERIAEKFKGTAFPNGFTPTVKPNKTNLPRTWKTPRKVFVNSMSDLFHEAFTDAEIDAPFNVMAEVSRHTYQVLTKRPERMAGYIAGWLERTGREHVPGHIWLGTSIESDKYVGRADHLRSVPVPVRFLSLEPLLEAVPSLNLDGISWVIVGGESGPTFRPMDHEWARDLRDRCLEAGVAFYFKQSAAYRTEIGVELDGRRWEQYPDVKKATRRLLQEKPTKKGVAA